MMNFICLQILQYDKYKKYIETEKVFQRCFADFQKAKLKTLCSLDIRRLSIW